MKKTVFLFVLLFCALGIGFSLELSIGLVISDKVRVRAAASTDAKVVAQYDTGAVLPIISRGEYGERLVGDLPSSYWYEVDTPKGRGFVWGGFFWPLSNQLSVNSSNGLLYLQSGKAELFLRPVMWADSPDQGNDMPEYDEHELLSFRGRDDEFWFVKVPKQFQKSENRVAMSPDGLLLLSSGMGGSQELSSTSLLKDQLSIEISEQTNGGQVYLVNITAKQLATKNPKLGFFEVTSITVKEKP